MSYIPEQSFRQTDLVVLATATDAPLKFDGISHTPGYNEYLSHPAGVETKRKYSGVFSRSGNAYNQLVPKVFLQFQPKSSV